MKFKRKVGQTALAGAIAFGGLGLGAVLDTPVPGLKANTASADVYADDYNGDTWHNLRHNVDQGGMINSIITRPSFTTGATLGGIVKGDNLFNSNHVKLYQITNNDVLLRWKTITPTSVTASEGKAYQYVTLITSVYPKGNYVAVHTFKQNGVSRQEYKLFTIN